MGSPGAGATGLMRLVSRLLAVALLAIAPGVARPAVTPAPGPGDPRIRVVAYDPNEVVELRAAIGYQMTLEFGPGERIENVSIGDGLGWQVTPNHKANLLFLKPLDVNSATDMTVITNLRRYVFDLSARRPAKHGDRSLIYRLRFEYPEPFVAVAEPRPAPPPAPPRDVNHAYHFEGSAVNLPQRVFDDGRATYFAFPPTADYPAIFAVDPDKREAVVNTAIHEGYVVVDRLAGAFVLRRGAEVTRIVNDGYNPPGGSAPALPKASKHRGLFR
jgi:type IV secretion system protein VirB9